MSTATFTTKGTYFWVVPANVTAAMVEVWGAGGGGGSNNCNNTTTGGRAGGGGGGYSRSNLAVSPGANLTGNVGAGGAGGVNNNNGTAGHVH